MLVKNVFSIPSKVDGLLLAGFYVKSEEKVKGVVYFVHGMAEHKERYFEVMEYLANYGYLCVIMDTRGHGGSVKSESDLGFFYDDTGEHCVEDVHQMITLLKEELDELPLILFGHSMGSLIVRAYTKKYDNEIDALVVCGSPSRNPMAKMALLLVSVLTKIKGKHYRSRFIHNLAFSSYAKRFNDTSSENNWLSTNQDNVKAYDEDKYSGFIFTLNGFRNLFTLMNTVYDTHGWNVRHKELPILFVAGEDDPCIDTIEKFKEAYGFFQKEGYEHVEHQVFKGMRHEILNETEKEEVFQYLREWMDNLFH